MLDPVALHQTRFNTPGVVPDGRGVLLGRLGALLFPSVDAMVGFFRIFGEQASLDEILPKLRIEEVRGQGGARQFLVLFHAASSYLVDRAARVSALVGGLTFTGAGKHFVKYRDPRSPLGYDARQLSSDAADFLLYDDRFTLALTRSRELPFAQLLLRLSPRALPGLHEPQVEKVWVLAREGLARSVLGYLWRTRARAEAAAIEPVAAGGPDSARFAGRPRWLLVRVDGITPRLLQLFTDMPGIELYQQAGERCLVQLGYRHPIRLDACASVFESEKLYVFSGTRDAVEVFAEPVLVPVQGLVERGFELDERGPPVNHATSAAKKVSVPLRLEASEVGDQVSAVLVPWTKAAWLRRLIYAAPQRLLQSAKVIAIHEGLFIVSDEGLSSVPIGTSFWRAAPGVYVPIGYRIEPAVAPDVVASHLGASAQRMVVFLGAADREAAPIALSTAGMVALGRIALEDLDVEERQPTAALGQRAEVAPLQVEHGDEGAFPLWGFRDDGVE